MIFRGYPDLHQVKPVYVLDVAPVTHPPFGSFEELFPDDYFLLLRRAKSIQHELRIEIQKNVSHVEHDVLYHASVALFSGRDLYLALAQQSLRDDLASVEVDDAEFVAAERTCEQFHAFIEIEYSAALGA